MNFNKRAAPDYVSESDHNALLDMRKQMWMHGLEGFATGFVIGRGITWLIPKSKILSKHITIKPTHRTAAPLLLGAIVMSAASISTARNNMHTIHHIMAKAPRQEQVVTEYQQNRITALENAPWIGEEDEGMEKSETPEEDVWQPSPPQLSKDGDVVSSPAYIWGRGM